MGTSHPSCNCRCWHHDRRRHGGLCVAYAQRVLRELETRQQFLRGVIFKLWHTPGYGGLYEKVLFYHSMIQLSSIF